MDQELIAEFESIEKFYKKVCPLRWHVQGQIFKTRDHLLKKANKVKLKDDFKKRFKLKNI